MSAAVSNPQFQGGATLSGKYLVRKLRAFSNLSGESERIIDAYASRRVVDIRPGSDIISEGEDPKTVNLIVNGWACRYKTLEDGRRQILSFFIPGDLADLHVYILSAMDHSIAALTPLRYALITPSEFEKLGDENPNVLRALWWDSLLTASIQREWLVTAGQRNALESVSHLACELFIRMKMVGLVENGRCNFPLTQSDIADALGMTQPHVSRTIKELNQTGIAAISRGSLTVYDIGALKNLAMFNPNYLHHLYEAAA
jgi:CRP-like cAMP-binding protein